MIKKISASDLLPGMFVHHLDCGWMKHPFARNRFQIEDRQTIRKILDVGIAHVHIDTDKGRDLDSPPPGRISADPGPPQDGAFDDARRARVPVLVERERAQALFREASAVVKNLMREARVGNQVEIQALDPLAERMVKSVIRSPYALPAVSRIKTKDEYTFLHCVSVAGLMSAFAVEMGLPAETVHGVALGGMVHDIGKVLVPDAILNKPGRLEPAEFDVIKRHVELSGGLLREVPDLAPTAVDVTMGHHERMDGSGYPLGLKGGEISLVGQMAAIVDVYDALTSVRVYKSAWEPTVTLKKLLEWSPQHFNRELVQRFIKCLGIYPVGSLVELASGRVGIVVDQGTDMLHPLLRIVYHAKRRCYLKVRDMNLAKESGDRIVTARSPVDLGIDLSAFV